MHLLLTLLLMNYSHFQFLLHHSLFLVLKNAFSFFLIAQPEPVNVLAIIMAVILMVLVVLIVVLIVLKCRKCGGFSDQVMDRWTGGDSDQIQFTNLPHASQGERQGWGGLRGRRRCTTQWDLEINDGLVMNGHFERFDSGTESCLRELFVHFVHFVFCACAVLETEIISSLRVFGFGLGLFVHIMSRDERTTRTWRLERWTNTFWLLTCIILVIFCWNERNDMKKDSKIWISKMIRTFHYYDSYTTFSSYKGFYPTKWIQRWNFCKMILCCILHIFATLLKWNIQWVVLKVCSILFENRWMRNR